MIENKEPKVLLLDIETSPSLGYVWAKWETNVIEFKEEWFVLSFSAKWLGGKQITRGLCDYDNYENDLHSDVNIIKELWNLFDEADVIIAHNGDQFDIKKIQARFSYYQLPPPTPFKTIDTKKVAKKYFSFNSNSLNDLGVTLGYGKKEKHDGFETWTGCMAGDKAAWKVMKKYNAKDVVLLEKVYLHFLPWISNHPNIGAYVGKAVCPNCGSVHLQSRGWAITSTCKYKRLQCMDCAKWSRDNVNVQIEKPLSHIT